MKGYKVFEPDWTCRGFQYEVGRTYEMEEEPVCCEVGFHFCNNLIDCFNYYRFDPNNKVAEIEATGEINNSTDTTDSKCCTNKITILRELTWTEVLGMVNIGFDNTGIGNSGDRNSGNYNSGDGNLGLHNSGDANPGNYNSGSFNFGNCNSGNFNLGDYNSGNHNCGYNNSGYWNCGSLNSGIFNTEWDPKIKIFDCQSDWTMRDWFRSDAFLVMQEVPQLKSKLGAGGLGSLLIYLFECRQQWWDTLDERSKKAVMDLPNFDPTKFEKCTGIKVYGGVNEQR